MFGILISLFYLKNNLFICNCTGYSDVSNTDKYIFVKKINIVFECFKITYLFSSVHFINYFMTLI